MLTENDYLLAAHAIADREDTDSVVRLLATIIASIRDVLPQGEDSAVGQTYDAMVSRLASLGLTAQLLNERRAEPAPARRFRAVRRARSTNPDVMFAVHDTHDGRIALFMSFSSAFDVAEVLNREPTRAHGYQWCELFSNETLTEIH